MRIRRRSGGSTRIANRFFLDPVLLGRYPDDVMADLAPVTDFSHVREGDLEIMSRPLSMLGVNYYSRHVVAAPPVGADGQRDWRGAAGPSPYPGSEAVQFVKRGLPVTAMGWEIDAPGLTEVLRRVAREYPEVPLYITENGAAFDDTVAADGTIEDGDRQAFLADHLAACLDAIGDRGTAARLLRLVVAGQLRVGLGLYAAIRPGLCGLREPGPDPEGQCPLVRRGDCPPRAARAHPCAGCVRLTGTIEHRG